jgi:hypothetical protein
MMPAISEAFACALAAAPEETYSVLVVFASVMAASSFQHPAASRPMETIVAVPLTGHEILRLARREEVLSIEPDTLISKLS